MAKYLITASYTAEGMRGLQKDKASGRRNAVREACESIGGKLEAFYFAFGEDDVVTIVDLPDNIAASAVSPGSSRPPGPLILPAPRPRFLRISSTLPSWQINSRVARSWGCHAAQSTSSNRAGAAPAGIAVIGSLSLPVPGIVWPGRATIPS